MGRSSARCCGGAPPPHCKSKKRTLGQHFLVPKLQAIVQLCSGHLKRDSIVKADGLTALGDCYPRKQKPTEISRNRCAGCARIDRPQASISSSSAAHLGNAVLPLSRIKGAPPRGTANTTTSSRTLGSHPRFGSAVVICAPDLTPKEIDKIKGVEVFRRTSKDALKYAVGFWEKKNNWAARRKTASLFRGEGDCLSGQLGERRGIGRASTDE